MGFWWVMRELDLDRTQRRELWALASDIRVSFRTFQWDGLDDLESALDITTAESFDRARLEEIAAQREGGLAEVRRKLVDALEKAHKILRPEQRVKLREILARFGHFGGGGGFRPAPAGGGPYRI
jgi:Spy/CpxP family protein refolding chaperone